jgi:hypothetical protein
MFLAVSRSRKPEPEIDSGTMNISEFAGSQVTECARRIITCFKILVVTIGTIGVNESLADWPTG